MNLSERFIRLPVMTTLAMVALLGVGLLGWRNLPVSDLPRIDFPTIMVTAGLPGADPETMAATVATPLERQFATIAGVDSMTSTSTQGQSQVTLQFVLGRDIDAAAQDVQAAIAAAGRTLPPGLPTPPTWQKVNPAELPVLVIAVRSDTLPMADVHEAADTLLGQRLSSLPGVAQVQIFGPQKRAVRIQADPDRLTARDLGFDELANAVARGTSNRPTGTLWGRDQAWAVASDAGLSDAASFRPVTVAWRGGAPVRLEEVARVIDGVQTDKVAAWYKDTRAVILGVNRQPGANTVEVVDRVQALLPRLRDRLPAQVSCEVLIDRSLPIRASLADVEHTLLLTAALVVAVIFVFLRRLSATVIPALSLPLSLVGTFAAMWCFGFSLNNLSLMALTLATGFVVDDAIVVLEAIVHRMEQGEDPRTAALEGSRRIGFTILSMTVSLMAVFIPILFMEGLLGRLFREFAATVMVAIAVSGFVSLTLVPMLCARFLRPVHATPGRLARLGEAAFDGLLSGYRRSLDAALRHRRWVLASLAASVALTVVLFQAVPKGMIPNEDLGQIRIVTEYATDVSFDEMARRQRQVAAIVLANPNVAAFMSNVGGDGGRQGSLFIRLKDAPARTIPPEAVIAQLRRDLAGVVGVRISPQVPPPIRIGGRLAKTQFQYTLTATDAEALYPAAETLLTRLRGVDGFTDLSTDLLRDSPRLVVAIDHERAAAYGVSPARIETTLGQAYGAQQIATIQTDTDQYQVILEADPARQQDPQELARLPIRPDAGGPLVPLGSVARLSRGIGPQSVNHQGQFPAVTIFFNLKEGTSLGTAVERLTATAAQVLPAGVTGSFSGAAQAFQSSLASMGILLLLSIAVIYLILGMLYESFIHPLTILSGLPSAGIGALAALLLFNDELNVYSFIGIIMLIGIVKKNAIMMVDHAIQARHEGADAHTAIRDGCLVRFRPIMMTTAAALMGTLPLAIGLGTESASRRSLGIAVIGGLLLSQFITLYITPVVYLYLDRLEARFRRPPTAPGSYSPSTNSATPVAT